MYPYDYRNQLNQFQQYPQYQQQYPQQYQPYYPQATQMQQNIQALSGKYVDSIDVVKATEVPMGGNGIFPKADLSEIYIKAWNADGTTNIVTFKPEVVKSEEPKNEAINSDIIKQLEELSAKIDKLTKGLGA